MEGPRRGPPGSSRTADGSGGHANYMGAYTRDMKERARAKLSKSASPTDAPDTPKAFKKTRPNTR